MHNLVKPNEWVAVKLPSESIRVIQIIPNTYDAPFDCFDLGDHLADG